MEERVAIDWKDFGDAILSGQFMQLLVKLPRQRWGEQSAWGMTLLYYACAGPNVAAVKALLQSGSVDVNAREIWGGTPAHAAANALQPCVLEALCAAGADLRASNKRGCTPIDQALAKGYKDNGMTARALVANGVRLNTVREDYSHLITPELVAFECSVLCCRTKVAALLRVKKAGNLWRWDEFLLREVAIAVWSTRYDNKWQK